jgi:hypothetical protein
MRVSKIDMSLFIIVRYLFLRVLETLHDPVSEPLIDQKNYFPVDLNPRRSRMPDIRGSRRYNKRVSQAISLKL